VKLSKKLKTALDETRILMLGGNILLGFGLRSVFAEGFDRLSPHARALDGVGLMLMVIVVGLLITPDTYHRIVERGADSGQLHRIVTDIAGLALLPFGLAIGFEVFIAGEQIYGTAVGVVSGAIATLLALALWYGLPEAGRRQNAKQEQAMTQRQSRRRVATPLDVRIEQTLTEARIILPGAQALFGFQLSIVLTRAFEQLAEPSRLIHALSIGLIALSVLLLMAPAAYHRIACAGENTEETHRLSSALVTAATVPLALGLAGDIYVVIAKIAGVGAGLAATGLSLVVLLGLWYAYPLAIALRREGRGWFGAKPSGQSR